MPLVDAHCHLQDPRFAADLEDVVHRARLAGVVAMVTCGTREADWDPVLDLARDHPGVVPMLGLHPWYVDAASPEWALRLEDRLRTSGAGVGECGLDFAAEGADREAQERAFRTQVRLARVLDRPLSVHCRRAWERLAAIAREEGLPAAGALVHAFGGSAETARELQELGFHLSFSCAIAHPENRRAAKVLPEVRADRLLLETDAPDLPPRHLPGWDPEAPNEPAHVRFALEAAARLRGEPVDALQAAVHGNARRLFGRWLP